MSGARLALRDYRLRFATPVTTAHGTWEAREGVLLTLHVEGPAADSAGAESLAPTSRPTPDYPGPAPENLVGVGEAAPLVDFGTEPLAHSRAALEAVARDPRLLAKLLAATSPAPSGEEARGQDLAAAGGEHGEGPQGHTLAARVDAALDDCAALSGVPAARFGLETALLDLAARRAGVPLARLLDPDACEEIAVSALLAGSTPAALAEAARATVAEGHHTVKLKVAHGSLAEDLARVAAVRAALGAGGRLRLDANGGWSFERAVEALHALARFEPELCEQPIAPGDPSAFARLRALSPVLLAADESAAVPEELAALLAQTPPIGAVVLKAPALGGLWRALCLARRAQRLGVEVVVTTALEGTVGRAAAAHLAAACGGDLAHGLATGRLLAEDHGPDALAPAKGRIVLRGTRGLGVAVEAAGRRPDSTSTSTSTSTSRSTSASTRPTIICPVFAAARLRPSHPALVHSSGTWTYAQLDARVAALAAALPARGVALGDTLALLTEADPDAVALLFAAARAGVTVALLNARLTQAELLPLVERSRATLLVAQGGLVARLPGALALSDLLASPSSPPASAAPEVPLLDPGAVWTLLFTSGTTGAPKAAETTVGAHLASAQATRELLALDPGTRFVCCLPLFHVGGFAIAVRCALVGGAAVLHERFDAVRVSRALDEGATHVSLVATTLSRTLDAREGQPPPPALRAVLVGGGPVPPPLLARARAAGLPVLQTYGLTETSSQATCERPDEADGATAGPPMPGLEVRIVDAGRAALPALAEGDIEVRGPTLLRAYRDDLQATARALDGGWLRTGDLGVLDERGRLRVLSRRTDLIVTGGENVYPAEVEAVLLAHPAVAEAAVAARPDGEWGEAVVALIVPRAGLAGGGDVALALRAFCRERLAAFKTPREVRFVEALPRTAAGKVDRAALRRLLEKATA